MNWQAIGAMGEVVGGLAVVLSVLYLAIQVRHNTAEMRAAASESITENLRQWLLPMIQDPQASRIFRLGAEGWEGFDADDKARFFHMMFVWLKNIEAAHYQYTRGRLDPQMWEGWQTVIGSYLDGPGVRAYWEQRKGGFSEPFQRYVDSIPRGQRFLRVGQATGEAVMKPTG
jgi:hypothetical protein